ncbi:MAG TPA: hypothetical protein VMK12_33205 [Anaeromyxobacteraceae bacterium]|nr:hypothetical protein [Anaeromyxobacteraceae bacterium]
MGTSDSQLLVDFHSRVIDEERTIGFRLFRLAENIRPIIVVDDEVKESIERHKIPGMVLHEPGVGRRAALVVAGAEPLFADGERRGRLLRERWSTPRVCRVGPGSLLLMSGRCRCESITMEGRTFKMKGDLHRKSPEPRATRDEAPSGLALKWPPDVKRGQPKGEPMRYAMGCK